MEVAHFDYEIVQVFLTHKQLSIPHLFFVSFSFFRFDEIEVLGLVEDL